MAVPLAQDRSVLLCADPPPPPDGATVDSPIAKLERTFSANDAERLLWRAGFGPRTADEPVHLAELGLEGAVTQLTRPRGTATLTGRAPRTSSGDPLAPLDAYGHDLLFWLDRMVRSDQPHVERLALTFHDWFATSNASVGTNALMLRQTNVFRARGLGSFSNLLHEVTRDPAMLVFLNGIDNAKGAGNENYAREVMELFTLGADRGAYDEHDVRELARALTGWTGAYSEKAGGWASFRYRPEMHDGGVKNVFGMRGRFDWRAACDLLVEHDLHPSFFVAKLWSSLSRAPLDAEAGARLEHLYRTGGHEIRPVLEAMLCSPQLYDGPRMVKPPAVLVAGLLRGLGRGIETESWEWLMRSCGQRLYEPPNVAGWNDDRWLDTSRVKARWDVVVEALADRTIARDRFDAYPADETPPLAVERARRRLGSPTLAEPTRAYLERIALAATPARPTGRSLAQRQNALRQVLPMTPEYQTS